MKDLTDLIAEPIKIALRKVLDEVGVKEASEVLRLTAIFYEIAIEEMEKARS